VCPVTNVQYVEHHLSNWMLWRKKTTTKKMRTQPMLHSTIAPLVEQLAEMRKVIAVVDLKQWPPPPKTIRSIPWLSSYMLVQRTRSSHTIPFVNLNRVELSTPTTTMLTLTAVHQRQRQQHPKSWLMHHSTTSPTPSHRLHATHME